MFLFILLGHILKCLSFLLIPKAKSNAVLVQIQVWKFFFFHFNPFFVISFYIPFTVLPHSHRQRGYFLMAWQAAVSVGPDFYWLRTLTPQKFTSFIVWTNLNIHGCARNVSGETLLLLSSRSQTNTRSKNKRIHKKTI